METRKFSAEKWGGLDSTADSLGVVLPFAVWGLVEGFGALPNSFLMLSWFSGHIVEKSISTGKANRTWCSSKHKRVHTRRSTG